jgi:hypothetical protein
MIITAPLSHHPWVIAMPSPPHGLPIGREFARSIALRPGIA